MTKTGKENAATEVSITALSIQVLAFQAEMMPMGTARTTEKVKVANVRAKVGSKRCRINLVIGIFE